MWPAGTGHKAVTGVCIRASAERALIWGDRNTGAMTGVGLHRTAYRGHRRLVDSKTSTSDLLNGLIAIQRLAVWRRQSAICASLSTPLTKSGLAATGARRRNAKLEQERWAGGNHLHSPVVASL